MAVSPVFVPSKGRPKSKLFGMLKESGLEYYIVIEPQELEAYSEHENNLILLPLNDQGLVYSRQYILTNARLKGLQWFWMLDDDITAFWMSDGTKNHPITTKQALMTAERTIKSVPGTGIGALEYQQYSWSAKKEVTKNSYCEVCVLINAHATTGISNYDKEREMKEDRDFVLQIITNGLKSVRTNKISFSTPKNASNKGGLQQQYQTGKEEEASKKLSNKWPGIVTLQTKKDGRKDAKINWKKLGEES